MPKSAKILGSLIFVFLFIWVIIELIMYGFNSFIHPVIPIILLIALPLGAYFWYKDKKK